MERELNITFLWIFEDGHYLFHIEQMGNFLTVFDFFNGLFRHVILGITTVKYTRDKNLTNCDLIIYLHNKFYPKQILYSKYQDLDVLVILHKVIISDFCGPQFNIHIFLMKYCQMLLALLLLLFHFLFFKIDLFDILQVYNIHDIKHFLYCMFDKMLYIMYLKLSCKIDRYTSKNTNSGYQNLHMDGDNDLIFIFLQNNCKVIYI
ncbi:hypothetical protein KUTeg_017074 [Tegillarca granosa]|uniref:Uncharacterized protein n=1 Tax=Tegillarca granosa TaxID=220873 RepID=A0ABQ9EMM8_TEGGR|nr:hypothetical protein KUTeg_017074 [Tegillarca granosa]